VLLEGGDEDHSTVGGTVVKAGIGGFLYLEVLDASFSFDGVVVGAAAYGTIKALEYFFGDDE
jgi:hypothetical protein